MSGTETDALERVHKVPYRWAPLLLIALAAAIMVLTWPWARTFSSAVYRHWDPPFHAWKLEFAARQILEGRILPPEGNTNMYYPYTGAFYFEALHWPQALVAALLFGLTNAGPVLVYHIVLIFFWALSGVCFWMLLRALGLTALPAVLGALFFTLMPYRMSYKVEFNMQLCFAIPLFFFFFVRYFQRPCARYACGMAVAWWLQATSELYQAVFLTLLLPYPALAMMSGRWSLLKSFKKFWLPMLLAGALGGVLTYIWLWEYIELLQSQTLSRGLPEIRTHILEPLSYLLPYRPTSFLPHLNVKREEMSVYATIPVLALASAYLVRSMIARNRHFSPRWVGMLRGSRGAVLFVFLALAILTYFTKVGAWGSGLVSALPIAACLISAVLMLDCGRCGLSSAYMEGMFAAAVCAFFLGFGPEITAKASGFACPNPLYAGLYSRLHALQGFRVVSRFAFFVLFWLTLAAAFFCEKLLGVVGKRARGASYALLAGLLVLFVAESMAVPHPVMALPVPLHSTVLDELNKRSEPNVLAMLPMGFRKIDSQHMLQVASYKHLSVYAWGGTYPEYTARVCASLLPSKNQQPDKAVELLRQLWPDCLIIEDKAFTRRGNKAFNYAEWFAGEATVVAEDERFVLMRLEEKQTPTVEYVKLVRHDYMKKNPQVVFSCALASANEQATVWLELNGHDLGKWDLSDAPHELRISLPRSLLKRETPNRLRFYTHSAEGFFLRNFKMQPAPDHEG